MPDSFCVYPYNFKSDLNSDYVVDNSGWHKEEKEFT
jgi:hypothetical protein